MSRRMFGLGPLVAALVSIGLTACGGGGGGSGPGGGVTTPAPPPPTFTSWTTDVQPGVTTNVPGLAQEISVTLAANQLKSISPVTPAGGAAFLQTVDPDGIVTGIRLLAPQRTLEFKADDGDVIGLLTPGLVAAFSNDGREMLITAEPFDLGWDYQSFGVWQTADSPTFGTFGTASFGAATPGASVPTAGAASFVGLVSGLYIDPTGRDHIVGSIMTLETDFAARRATFASGDMIDFFADQAYRGTALSGALTYSPAQNALKGTLTTANGRLSGAASGRFYGPAAQEVGGVFVLTPTPGSSSLERLGGGFGASR